MIVAYGDLHLSSDRVWSYKVSKDVVDFIINNPLNNSENILILTGDITDKSIVDGSVTNLLIYLFENLNYKQTIICRGNHEGRLNNNKIVTPYDFIEQEDYKLKLKTEAIIIKELTELSLDGISTIILPHLYPQENQIGNKYYSSLPDNIYNKSYDLLISHLTDNRLPFPSPDKVDISRFKSLIKIMGHIHSGEFLNLGYIGSIIPNSISENDFLRYEVTIYRNTDGILKLETNNLPVFLEYKEIKFPNFLTRTKGKTVVWSFTNCSSEDEAKKHYNNPNLFIRKCTYTSEIDSEGFQEILEKSSTKEGFSFYLNDWISSKGNIQNSIVEKIQYYASKI